MQVDLAPLKAVQADTGQVRRSQGADRNIHLTTLGLRQHSQVNVEQVIHIVCQRLVDGKTHQNPANDQGRPHGHHHELVGHGAQQGNLPRAAGHGSPSHQRLSQRGQHAWVWRSIGVADGLQLHLGIELGSDARADARAVVVQR